MRLLCLVLLAAFATDAFAQVNTERMRRRLGDDGAAISLDASAAFADGNADFVLIGLGGRADVQRGRNLAFVIGQLDLSQTGGNAFQDRQFAHARFNRDLSGWLVAEAFAQVERNRQQRLDARTLVGAGLRAEIIDTDTTGVAVGLTPMIENEVLDDVLGVDPETRVRVSTYLSGRLALSSNTSLTTTTYVQPRVNDVDDTRILSQLSLSVALTRFVRLRVSANVRHDTRPPAGVEMTDIIVENGLTLVIPGG
ncbi:MAG: DUF481 domain-containing protein [Bacteroidota bacterium]